jgi:FAD/FMN-containing dehydrogenase
VATYADALAAARSQLAAVPAGTPVRLRKPTSNLFRPREQAPGTIDAEPFAGVLSIDVEARTADVGGMTTYAELVDATLPHGLMPFVVPQLKTITLGGAVSGLGIEATSFRYGLVHESVLEMDVLTGAGEVLTVRPDNEYSDLFFGFPNSFGTLGYALRVRIELLPVPDYVHVRHLRFADVSAAATAIAEIVATGTHDGETVDFLDGTWFSTDEVYLSLGTFCSSAPVTSDYTGQRIYYRSVQTLREDWLTVRDYLWRWDTDWFWCSRAFGAQVPAVRRLWPRRWRRSDVYWKLIALNRRTGLSRRLDQLRRRPAQEEVVQDIEVPVDRLAEFVKFLDARTGVAPVWFCPLRQRDPRRRWPLYHLDPAATFVNVGFWSTADLPPGQVDGYHNRAIEEEVARLGGAKSLYSTAFYPPEEFWATYGGEAYFALKNTYDPDHALLDLYDKTVARR